MSRSPRSRPRVQRVNRNFVWIATQLIPTTVVVSGREVVDSVVGSDWESLGSFEKGATLERCIVDVVWRPDSTATLVSVGDYEVASCWTMDATAVNPGDVTSFGAVDAWGVEHDATSALGIGITAAFVGTNFMLPWHHIRQDLKVRRKLTDLDQISFIFQNLASSDDKVRVRGMTRCLVRLPA